MRTGLTQQGKTTGIWLDEEGPLIHLRAHNTTLKKRLPNDSRRCPAICRQPPQTGKRAAWGLNTEKGRFPFRLTAPYSRNAGKPPAKRQKLPPAALSNAWYNFLKNFSLSFSI